MFKNEKDVALSGLAGLLVGLLLLPIIFNIGSESAVVFRIVSFFGNSWILLTGFALAFGCLTAASMVVARLLSHFLPILLQIAKFVVVGVLNTFVDLGVLNLLMLATGVVLGPMYIVFKSISFISGSLNSYVWNKYWTFESRRGEAKEVIQFFIVSIVGFLINVGIASAVANNVSIAGFSDKAMANIGALAGTIIGLTWNFLGYKFIVFSQRTKYR